MQRRDAFPPLAAAILTSLAGAAIYQLSLGDFIDLKPAFVLLNLLLFAYLTLEINRVRRLHPVRWLINPAVFCSLMTFVLFYGVTNLLYFLPEATVATIGVLPVITAPMNKLMVLVIIGALAMWLGYWSPIAARLNASGPLVKFRARYFQLDVAPQPWVLPALLCLSLLSRVLQIWLGVFGYSSTYERLIEAGSFTQYLAMGSSLGQLALVLAAFQYYSPKSGRRGRKWFLGILIYEILFGFLSGFKNAVVLPFIIVMLCQYLRLGRLSRYWIIAVPLAIMVAFAVIEPFRVSRNADVEFQGSSLTNIATTMTEAAFARPDKSSEEKSSFALSFMGRSNLTCVGSLGIAFADANETLPAGSPAFLEDIFLSPLHALVPRVIWKEKPLGNLGLWYTQTVMGHEFFSSTGMGPFTYLYFAGGTIAVFVGFFFLGIVQRALFFITQPFISSAGGIVFLVMFTTVVMINSAFNGIIVTLFRELPLVLIIQSFLYKPRRRIALR